ncbi:hypothetical protein K469DRAFT_127056 [Zopfia rhizophila CBS 207.26]|uniref:Uncharacterized protein n=1 Tax=Zopfia rhizophila CBS 207.26 TaxID=1314779 RepID=A0A6A6ES79_9PEZI|nr:hypothetical protein K469DRAFT_127056 [Zopfia rhizophila CBS 207.26]
MVVVVGWRRAALILRSCSRAASWVLGCLARFYRHRLYVRHPFTGSITWATNGTLQQRKRAQKQAQSNHMFPLERAFAPPNILPSGPLDSRSRQRRPVARKPGRSRRVRQQYEVSPARWGGQAK